MTNSTTEVWVSQVPGGTSIAIEDLRTGKERTLRVHGKSGKLRITPEMRELAEERIENPELNPFRNGRLVLQGDQQLSEQAMGDDDLAILFELDLDDFMGAVEPLSETNVRRLVMLAQERNAPVAQAGYVKEFLMEKWPIGGDTPFYRKYVAGKTESDD